MSENPPSAAAPDEANPKGAESGGAKPLVGVVEDNPDNRLVVRAMLKRRFRLAEYEEGSAALAGFAETRPDVVLLDISLPGMDGPEILKRMRSEPALAAIPVVALTAHAMAGDREELLASGFDDYVAKPILDPAEFVATIERLLRR